MLYYSRKFKNISGKQRDAEAKAPILRPCDLKSQFIGKYPDAGKD